jgi:hypothetical protein
VSIVDFAVILDLQELLVFFNHGENFEFAVTFNALFDQFVDRSVVSVLEEWVTLVYLDDLKRDSLTAN